MLTRIQQRLGRDDGLGLVEMMIAILILGFVLTAAASTFITSFVTISGAEVRTRATALANEELENLRALPWHRVGYLSTDTTLASLGLSSPVMVAPIASGPERTRPAVEPIPGTPFTVTRRIEWVDNPQTSTPEDYKNLNIEVSWLERGTTPRSVAIESIRAAAPDDQPPAPFVLSLFDAQPEVVRLNADGTPATGQLPTPMRLTAQTSSAAEWVTVSIPEVDAAGVPNANQTQVFLTQDPSNENNFARTYSNFRMANGEALLTFTAKRLSQPDVVFGTKIVRFLYPHAFRNVVLAPHDGVFCLGPEAPRPAVEVDVDVDGMVAEDTVQVTWDLGSAQGTVTGTSPTGTQYRVTIPADSYGDSTTLTIVATRLGDQSISTTRTVTVTRDVSC